MYGEYNKNHFLKDDNNNTPQPPELYLFKNDDKQVLQLISISPVGTNVSAMGSLLKQ